MNHLLTIADAIKAHARLTPQKTGARDSRRALTYAQWDQRADALARALLTRGLRDGDRVAILATNCIEWMEIYVALARAGLVAVPLNFRLVAAEIRYIVDDCEAAAFIAGGAFRETVENLRATLRLAPDRYVLIDETAHKGWVGYESLFHEVCDQDTAASNHPPLTDREFAAVSPDHTCALMYTSGTTGRPKGAIRNHAGSTLIALATTVEMGFTRDDTALLVMPLCHANSLYFGNTFMHLGATIVIDDRPSFDPEALLAALSEHGVTFTSLVPTHFTMMLALPDAVRTRYDVSRVGRLMISSAPARETLKREILDYFRNGRLYELYGSTEAGWVTLLRPDEQIRKLGSVGREWAGSGAIRLLDEQDNEVPDGEVGELFSRTPYVFDGYWNNPEKTAEAFRGQWCSVGDIARRDQDGYIWLVDRKSNMIISGGENIYPSEIEDALSSHDAVRDVAVIGLPDDKWGETVHAVIVLHEDQTAGADELQRWCRERLSGYKCPRRMQFVQEADLPRTATGKIQHRKLRDWVLAQQ